MGVQRVVKPRTQQAKRALEKRSPLVVENTKVSMFIKGGKTSNVVTEALKDLCSLKKPHAIMFKRKNIMRPFDDVTPIEGFSQKSDASLFIFGSHSKKKPDNFVLGRMFDHRILDMIELGITKYRGIAEFETTKCSLGTKPCLLFAGEQWEATEEMRRLKNMLIDFFRGPEVSKVRLAGLEHVLAFTAVDDCIALRSYKILLKKSGTKTPRIELDEMGPSLDFVIRRSKLASDALYKQAKKKPRKATQTTKKNVSRDVFGSTLGRVHMQKQDLSKIRMVKVRALKKSRGKATVAAGPQKDTALGDAASGEEQ